MISWKLQVVMLAALVIYFFFLFYFLKKNRLDLKYTLLWIFSGVLMLLLTVFPQILTFFASLVGVDVPSNALFAVVLFCIIMIGMSLTTIVSQLNTRAKRLTQSLALLEKRVRDLEAAHQTTSEDDA